VLGICLKSCFDRSRKMDEKVKSLINQVKTHLIKTYGGKIKKVILYGSHVRSEATKDSDIDVLVLVDQSLNPFEVRESLSDLLIDILLEQGELVSVIAIPESIFESYNSPFILNVRKEGLVA
jgi:predicted nucleotidyltransferase